MLRESLALYAARLVSLAATAAAAIILARRLDVQSYALYQFATKRLHVYLMAPVVAASYWAYRYLAQRVPGALRAYLLVLAADAALAVPIAYLALIGLIDAGRAAILGLCTASLLAQHGLAVVAPSVDAYGAALASIARSLTFSSIVVILWYTGSLGLEEVAAACIAASTVYTVILLLRLRGFMHDFCRRCLGEWVKGSWVPLLNWLFGFIGSLDVPVVLALAGERYVAAFFAVTLLPRLSADMTGWGFGRIHAYLLETGDYASVARTARLILSLHAFIVAYVAANPHQASAFAGKEYLAYATYTPILALPLLLYPLDALLTKAMSGADRSRAAAPGKLIRRLPLVALSSNTIYVASLTLLLVAGVHPLIAWPVAHTLGLCTGVTMRLLFLPKYAQRELAVGVVAPLAGYTLAAYMLSLVLSSDAYSTMFFDNLVLTLRSAVAPLVLYYILLALLDPSVRAVALRIATLAARALHPRASREAASLGSS